MNILYIGYWSVIDSLSEAAIRPHLLMLSGMDSVDSIIYISIERDVFKKMTPISISKCIHIPLYSRNIPFTILNKFFDYYSFPKRLKAIIAKHKIDLCIGAGTQAGALLYLACKENDIPFVVSYYDPHADYMYALGVWKVYDPRYVMLHYWEKQLKKYAKAVFPVSHGYANTLISEGINDSRVYTVPCATDLTQFIVNTDQRLEIRRELNWPHEKVGIYVGKFGDIYFDDEAFMLFKRIKSRIPDFKLIILSSAEQDKLRDKLAQCGFMQHEIYIAFVAHSEVPKYLNAADVAFCLHRPHRYSYAYSPIKNGEYWACGLPVIISENIGDDSSILKDTALGVVLNNVANMSDSEMDKLNQLLSRNAREEIRKLAMKHRSTQIARQVFAKILATVT